MIIVDSGSIISLAVNCLCPLMTMMGRQFIITPKVYDEIISKPSESKRFALESMRIKKLITLGGLEIAGPKTDLADKILEHANKVFQINGENIAIIHDAEAEVIGLALEMDASAMLIDERTTRLLLEDPEGLRLLLMHRNNEKVTMDKNRLRRLKKLVKNIPIIRSAEIVAIAYEKGLLGDLLEVKDKSVLEAALSAVKFSGCSIAWWEIDEYLKDVI